MTRIVTLAAILSSVAALAEAPPEAKKQAEQAYCATFKINPKASKSLAEVSLPPKEKCQIRFQGAIALPDPKCTPGAVNPTVTEAVLRDPQFRTTCVRNDATSEAAKAKVYAWYGIKKPKGNTGQNQVCELDHVVSLELGGADTLDNIWPQCGPDYLSLNERFFMIKDRVENWLADRVRTGKMPLAEAQRGIAENWTQYIEQATFKKSR